MKGANRIFATCVVAGAIVAFLVWFTWDLPWQGLGLGLLAGLILYANMIGRPKSKLDKEKEDVIHGLPPVG
jgi:RsiW-degrading membrane proteinase PrsW (M82 family)